MKHVISGANELFFSILRDLPYFQPSSNYYGISVRSFDSNADKTFLVRDVSTSPSSYQHFLLTATTASESLTDAVVKLLPYGTWYASVLAATGSTLASIDTTQILWTGMLHSAES